MTVTCADQPEHQGFDTCLKLLSKQSLIFYFCQNLSRVSPLKAALHCTNIKLIPHSSHNSSPLCFVLSSFSKSFSNQNVQSSSGECM